MSEDFREKFKRAHFDPSGTGGLEIIRDQKMVNSATYVLHLEDHTLGDLLRISLLKKKEVKFAGYRMPHPLVDKVEIKVQTTTEKTGEVVKETLVGLQKNLYDLETEFETELARVHMG